MLLSRVSHRDREISGALLRALLALLADDLRAGASTGRLVDGLWPDTRPEHPTRALQVLVSRTRALLGPDIVAATPTGYRLCLADEQVDAAAVRLAAAASAAAARGGDHPAALAHAEAGLAMWDAEPDSDAEPGDPLAALRADRAAVHRALRRRRALALSRLGRAGEAFDALSGLVDEHPRDEELLRELLRSEAAAIGPAAALARYDAYRRTLRDELGTDPGPELRALHGELLRERAPTRRHGVPHEPNLLLGRDADLAAVTGLLRSSRVASIVGPGGLGKTRLALAVGHTAEQRVVHVVTLAGVGADADVPAEVATALGLGEHRSAAGREDTVPDLLTGILTALGPGPVLLVLDNCEQVVAGVAELVGALVAMSRDLRVLTTSRAPLGLTSESVYPLPALDPATTVELFGQRARAARPGVELPADVVEQLCGRLDGLPLAVELAAARVRVLSVGEIARRLDDRFALLRGGARDTPQRHRTLHAVVDWSWNLLDPAGQAAWRALAMFPGGFTADAAGHLLDVADPLAVVEHLADQSLLTVVDDGGATRFRMLETVREFGAARRGEAETVRAVDGLLAWAREFGRARHAGPFGPDAAAAYARIRAEQDNLAFALRHALARGDGSTVVATAAVLGGLWTVGSDFRRLTALTRETADILVRLRPAPEDVEVARVTATLGVGTTFVLFGPRPTRSLLALRRLPAAPPDTLLRAMAVVLATPGVLGPGPAPLRRLAAGSPLLAGVAHAVESYLRAHAGDPAGGLRAAELSAAAFDGRDHPWMWVLAQSRLVELRMLEGDGERALTHIRAVAPLLDALGGAQAFQMPWVTALAHLQRDDPAQALRCLRDAPSTRDLDTSTATFDLAVRAEVALARGEVDAGLRLWRDAVERLRDTGGLDIDLPGPDPWTLELHATSVVAHARHRRLDLVGDVVAELPATLSALLGAPVERPPGFFVVQTLWGALLLAQAMVDLVDPDPDPAPADPDPAGHRRRTAARMIACAERLHFPQQFRPTMSGDVARSAARHADGPAYDDAVSSYAGLGPEQLRLAALELLDQRAGSRS